MEGVAVAATKVPAVLEQATFGVRTTAPHGLLLAGCANAPQANKLATSMPEGLGKRVRCMPDTKGYRSVVFFR